ncbi:hypothetical protein EKH79_14030 [Dyella dinghuensis]|uniref:DUF6966 domain-containing protein n=1 Tax=Dyella dinghuensis TaxID=1920169 RepID=A0A432LPB3_9GAMM|nr:hypothetical protein [Dyella dinghuensis]RUL62029.1 hypothetical protein EKH79_14030 [Dyella dinghuensis]
MNHRREQLEELNVRLGELLLVLTQDPLCQWHKHFAKCQQRAAFLLSQGFTQSDLNELSGSVKHVYGGAGSFNDYAPVRANADGSFGIIAGMDHLSELSSKVYDSALAIRVISHAP